MSGQDLGDTGNHRGTDSWPPVSLPPAPGGGPPVSAGAAQPFGGRPETARAILATVAAAAAAIILWFLVHKWSLLIDVLLGVWVGSTAVSGWNAGNTARRVDALFKIPRLPRPLPVVVSALACVPFAIGLLSLGVTELHHSSAADVCSSLSAYETASADNSVSDSAWFAALTKVGNTAADYAGADQGSVNAAGQAALRLANGNGNSDIVVTSVGQANAALGPVMDFCAAG